MSDWLTVKQVIQWQDTISLLTPPRKRRWRADCLCAQTPMLSTLQVSSDVDTAASSNGTLQGFSEGVTTASSQCADLMIWVRQWQWRWENNQANYMQCTGIAHGKFFTGVQDS